MLNLSPFITKDNNVFYFDVEEYNSKNDIPIEEGDILKFKYEGKMYFSKAVGLSNRKNDFLILQILN
jgi:hypothetical protein